MYKEELPRMGRIAQNCCYKKWHVRLINSAETTFPRQKQAKRHRPTASFIRRVIILSLTEFFLDLTESALDYLFCLCPAISTSVQGGQQNLTTKYNTD